MIDALYVLVVEDSEDDTALVIRSLRQNGFSPEWKRVDTAEALHDALLAQSWDVIISDYTLPKLDAPEALDLVQERCEDIPFIVVAGSIGERQAVEMMKAGAHDYVMKDSLTRLPEAVRRELREAHNRCERRQAERAIRRQLAAIETVVDGIGIIQNGMYIYVNQSHLILFGYDSTEELIGQSWKIVYSPDQISRFEQEIFPQLKRDRTWQGEAIATRKDGTSFAEGLSLSLTDDDLLICVCRDISDLKQAQDLILHHALHDPLTDLPNRNLLTKRLDAAIQRTHQQPDYRYAVLFLDLDRFKVVNDSLGHIVGDQLLIAVTRRLKQIVRDGDIVARLGGDEFVILLENLHHTQQVRQIAERILTDSQAPFHINGHQIFTSFSIGIVWGTSEYHRAVDLIRDADLAMYHAKAENHTSYQFFNTVMHTQAMDRLTLETDLRRAIEQEELEVYYQPIVDLQTLQLTGFEALVRWHHPQRGCVAPDDFVPLSEETGLITTIDEWVFQHVCQHLCQWRKQYRSVASLRVSINLSAQTLRKANLLQIIDSSLEQYGLTGDAITIEITETQLIDDIDQMIEILLQLASRQIQISIDDFGTGYSSLRYLHRLPAHLLKIDRSFVCQMVPKNRNYQVINTILALSQQLALTVVAEGIETLEQLQYLQTLECDRGQGYLFAQPLPPKATEQQLAVGQYTQQDLYKDLCPTVSEQRTPSKDITSVNHPDCQAEDSEDYLQSYLSKR